MNKKKPKQAKDLIPKEKKDILLKSHALIHETIRFWESRMDFIIQKIEEAENMPDWMPDKEMTYHALTEEMEFIVSRNVFQPKPDVDSAVLSFYPKDIDSPDLNLFSSFIQQSFSQRRKKLKNNLPKAHKAGVLQKWADMRPEEVSPSEFGHIFERIIFDGEQN